MQTTKILIPLATVVGAVAVAVGPGATYTSVSASTSSSTTSGPLTQSNSKARAAIFDATNIKPGDTVNGSLRITNTASRAARFQLVETESANPFGAGLSMVITNTTAQEVVYAGRFGGLVDGDPTDLGLVGPGVANDYTFTVQLDRAVTNADQGKTAAAAFQWHSIQADGPTNDD